MFRDIKEIFLELNEIKNFQAPAERNAKTSTELFRQLNLQDLLSNISNNLNENVEILSKINYSANNEKIKDKIDFEKKLRDLTVII